MLSPTKQVMKSAFAAFIIVQMATTANALTSTLPKSSAVDAQSDFQQTQQTHRHQIPFRPADESQPKRSCACPPEDDLDGEDELEDQLEAAFSTLGQIWATSKDFVR